MVENTFGLPENVFEDFKNIRPDEELAYIKAKWSMKPLALSASFFPGDEQKVVNFIKEGLLPEYNIKEVQINEVLANHPTSKFFLAFFFTNEINISKLSQGKNVYIFRGVDKLGNKEIGLLQQAEDLFERGPEGMVDHLIEENSIYPIIMQSIEDDRRIAHSPTIALLRTLNSAMFTGI